MTDRTDDVTERSDPVLVRPYVTTGDDDPAAASAAETWPETATLPEAGTHPEPASRPQAETAIPPNAERPARPKVQTATLPKAKRAAAESDTAIQPVAPPAAPPRSNSIHWALRLLVLVVGVAVALGVAAYFVRGGSRDDAQRGPSASLPAVNAPALTGGSSGSAPTSARPSSASPSARASSSPSASTSVALSVLPPVTRPATRTPATGPTLAAPPAADRTGRVTSAGGRCLVLGGLLGLDGSPIQVMTCAGGSIQQFTLATDGTLRVAGHCAEATGDASVRSAGCGGAGPAGQWRAGPSGSLVNPSSGKCLTDPGRTGATTSVAACTGGDAQHWSLP